MTLQQLQYLMEVYRTGSISGAAKNLFLAQSSLSASISSLETELGFPVFIRSKSGMIPTVQGAHVIEHAARICESYHAMTVTGSKGKRHIRISAPAFEPLNHAFVQLVDCYKNDPSVYFSEDSLTTADAAEQLSAFSLDAAILINHEARMLPVETLLKSKGLKWEKLATVPVVIQLGPGHPLYNKAEICPRDLETHLFADSIHDPLVRNEFLKGVLPLSPERTVSVKSAYTRNLLVAKGLSFTIGAGAPKAVAEANQLRTVPLENISYAITVVTNPLRPVCPEAETYISLIHKQFQK